MNQKKIIVDSPFTPVEIVVGDKTVELSNFSTSRGRQFGKPMHCLRRAKDNLRITFQACSWFKAFSLGISIFGLFIAGLPILLQRLHWDSMGELMLCGFILAVSGILIFVNQKTIVFDSHTNEFRYTNSILRQLFAVDLDKIIGVQLIELMETIEDNSTLKRKYYELNVVFENLERINLSKMTNLQASVGMANELQNFLQKPLWWIEIVR